MNPSKEHNNWIIVGEIINLLKEPVALYTTKIVNRWHVNLCSSLSSLGTCTAPLVCQTKTNAKKLCASCNGWYIELEKSHRNKAKPKQIKWRENCETSKWSIDPWEVAKFYMPVLGGNKATVKNAESTDVSSLLNVLAWMEDVAFAPDVRVARSLVEKLRSDVRNPWAHAPNQELTEAELNDSFDIANKFVADLDKVVNLAEVKKCIKDIDVLQAQGLAIVAETELKILKLLSVELSADMNQMKADQSSDREVIKELERRLKNLETVVKSLQDGQERFQLKSCIPDKLLTYICRDKKVEEIISSLVEDNYGIVSIVGGPGFGKSTIAVEVSHHLINKHGIVVIFSLLSNVSTVAEVTVRLCHDVGINPGEKPESALMLWIKNIENKVVLVMDNIEQLLESDVKSQFTELILTLRKNSQQLLQILTTTRTQFSIPGQPTQNNEIGLLDKESSVKLLRLCCLNVEVEDAYMSKLADLCGFVPLALCIAGTLIPDLDDPLELIHCLKEKPMETLKNSDQCVRQAIEFSFEKLSDEDKKAFVRLSVFNGDFQKKSAQEVIGGDLLETRDILTNLTTRSLIQRSRGKRFVIHSLIRRFLVDHDQLQNEKATAEALMVRHFLKLCHSLTMESYQKNKFTSARESLKNDAHNVEETLRICSQEYVSNLKPNVLEVLTSSDIYRSSSRIFYKFCRDLLPRTVLRSFFESCIKLAENRKQPAIQITFLCLVADQEADQEGRKAKWSSTEYVSIMKGIKEMLQENEEVLKEDVYLFYFCHYSYAKYDREKASNGPHSRLPEDSLDLIAENKALSPIESASAILFLLESGKLKKKHAGKMYRTDQEKYEKYTNCAQSFYNRALSLAKDLLGDHEVTCTLYKLLGDLYLTCHKNEEALTYYSVCTELRKKLRLDSNEPFVFLLKNYGACLRYLGRFAESVEKLNEACDIADKLDEKNTTCRAEVYYELAITFSCWKPDCQEAAKYAKTAMEMRKLLSLRSVKKLEGILKMADNPDPMHENKAPSPIESDSDIFSLMESGKLKKKHAGKIYRTNNENYEKYMNCAESFFNRALSLAKDRLGDHKVTCELYKLLGDLYLNWRKNEQALTYYAVCTELRRKLKLDSNERFVFLLKNYGACLCYLGRYEESVEKLFEARDIADKLEEKNTTCRPGVYYELAKTFSRWKCDCKEAAGYAKTAMDMPNLLDRRSVKTLEGIIKRAEQSSMV